MNKVEVHKIEIPKKEETPADKADIDIKEEFGDPLQLTRSVAITSLIMNIFLPGSGTILSGCLISGIFGRGLKLTGVVQILTAICLIGWIWAVYTGVMLIKAVDNPEVLFLGKKAFDDIKKLERQIKK
jgi:hypothetical protein